MANFNNNSYLLNVISKAAATAARLQTLRAIKRNTIFMNRILRQTCACIFAAALFASCSSKKSSLTYFEDISTVQTGEYPSGNYQVEIQPDDELFITVTSLRPEATAAYNLPMSNPGSYEKINEAVSTGRQQTFLVSPSGDINFPVLGKIHVAGLTTEQLTEKLTKEISADVVDPIVMVRLANFTVEVLGEVLKPGAYPVTRERFSLLDALAKAGDMTPYGDRTNVLLIREKDGKRTYHRLNLNDSDVLTSPYFYLQPNDVLMVQPNKIREENARYNQYNSYKLTVVSTVVSALSIIASLVIALTVK